MTIFFELHFILYCFIVAFHMFKAKLNSLITWFSCDYQGIIFFLREGEFEVSENAKG
jgi:hypothetical protein